MTLNNTHADWWKQAVVYQVYPRSFKDVNGDGLGDIAGVTDRIPYLKELGVDAIWLSPFYPSELADGGYDVIDYRDVDPRLGTMDDFDAMAAAAHEAGMKVIVDIVPNHTSDGHVWFQEALAAEPGSPARDRYIFRDGLGEHGELPPNDWQSIFGGGAWERVPDGQWYLHMFAKEQPDLNWKNPEVHEEFKKTLRFWSDHGADGFRIDVAHGLAKDLDSAPLTELALKGNPLEGLCHDGTNPLWDRPEVHDIYREWREVFNEYDPPRFAVGEAWVVPEHQHLYASEEELGQVFNFEFAKADWFAEDFRTAIREGLESAEESGSTTTWVMSNHDVVRHASRYGLPQVKTQWYHQLADAWLLRSGTNFIEDRELGTRRARAAIMMELGLPGSVYVYQGEELGMTNYPFRSLSDYRDLESINAYHEWVDAGVRQPEELLEAIAYKSRDNARTPMQWDGSANAGFTAGEPWIEVNENYRQINAEAEMADPDSVFRFYQKLIALRKEYPVIVDGKFTLLFPEDEKVFAYTRSNGDSQLLVLANFSGTEVSCPLPEMWAEGQVLACNYEKESGAGEEAWKSGHLRPYEAVMVLCQK